MCSRFEGPDYGGRTIRSVGGLDGFTDIPHLSDA